MCQPCFPDIARCFVGDIRPVKEDFALLHFPQSRDRLNQFRLSVAVNTRDADDLPRVYFHGKVPDFADLLLAGCPEILHLQHRLSGHRRFLFNIQKDLPADHHLSKLSVVPFSS